MAPPQVWGCPGDPWGDGGMFPPAQVTQAGGHSKLDTAVGMGSQP